MSNTTKTKATCFICGKEMEAQKWDMSLYLANLGRAPGPLGIQCTHCGAIFCKKHKKELKYNYFLQYSRSLCLKCGEPLKNGIILMKPNVMAMQAPRTPVYQRVKESDLPGVETMTPDDNSQSQKCPVCNKTILLSAKEIIDRKTNQKLDNTWAQPVSALAMISAATLISGFFVIYGISLLSGSGTVSLLGIDLPSWSAWFLFFLATLWPYRLIRSFINYRQADKITKTKYTCTSCKHTWYEE